jgi:hypothetical protein
MFEEAADIAETVPEELRGAACNRALDLLLARAGGGPGASEADAILRGSAKDKRLLGIYGSEILLEKSVDMLNFATTRLGMEELSAEQIAALVNERFGIPTTETVVSMALTGAGGLVRGIQRSGKTLYSIVSPAIEEPKHKPRKRKKNEPDPTPGQIVRDLVALGFFQSARTTADLVLFLEKKGIQFTTRQVIPVLSSLIAAGVIEKKKDRTGEFKYRAR